LNAIRTAKFFGAKTILVGLYTANCPNMDDESSFGPVVGLLQKMGQRAIDAGLRFGLETSLTPSDEKRLLGLIDRSNIRSYYDATNVETYHSGQGVARIEVLGPRIVECHLKNEDRLIGQQPSAVDWVAALKAFKQIHYNGWDVYETKHASPERCVQDTKANIDFVKRQLLSHS
jgi:sugar phosphate isomerase/epimerase